MAAIATLSPVKLEPYVNPRDARTVALEFWATQTIARGTIIGIRTATGQAGPYNKDLTDGTQTPVGPLAYDIVVDASRNVVYGPSGATADLLRGNEKTAEVYWRGDFLESELTGLDATAIAALGREIGVGAQKWIHIP